MRRYPGTDDDSDSPPYRRPALAAWVAAGAVAVAVFLLGGFIKTYQQLEALRESSRREIEELRLAVAELRQGGGEMASATAPAPVRPPRARPAPLPRIGGAAGREVTRVGPDADVASLRPAPARGSEGVAGTVTGNGAGTGGRVIPEIDLPLRPRMAYAVGRRSDPEALALAGPLGQVVSVASATKRLIIEGGRDVGLVSGARLEIYRDGRWVGDLRATDVYENQTACEVLHSTSDPLPGDMVRRPVK